MFRFAKLTYTTENLGDDLQTLATLPFLGNDPVPFNRDTLANQQSKEKYILIMNGWWADNPAAAFPPADCFIPVFIGFHIASRHAAFFTNKKCIEYFKNHQPIGCRDIFTQQLLQREGIETFLSGCLSTTFEKINSAPTNEVFLVDTKRIDYLIPGHLRKNAVQLTHHYSGHTEDRVAAVENLMNQYRRRPSLVITTRLHAALTCTALGIPVVFFFHPDDPRASTASQVGIRMYKHFLIRSKVIKKFLIKTKTVKWWTPIEKLILQLNYKNFEKINWQPQVPDIEDQKRKLKEQTLEMINGIIQRG